LLQAQLRSGWSQMPQMNSLAISGRVARIGFGGNGTMVMELKELPGMPKLPKIAEIGRQKPLTAKGAKKVKTQRTKKDATNRNLSLRP
jgi:hypothetical protein